MGVWLLSKLSERERRRDRLCLRERLRVGLREEFRREECRCERRDRWLRDERERRLFRERERSLGGEHEGDFRIDKIAQLCCVLEMRDALSNFLLWLSAPPKPVTTDTSSEATRQIYCKVIVLS